jgi:hypothetical protein
MGAGGGGTPRGGSMHTSQRRRCRGRATGGGRRRGGARASMRERDRLGRVGRPWPKRSGGGSGPAEGQGPGGWAKNLSWAQFKK